MKLFGSLTELVSAIFRKDSQQITLRPNSSITYTNNRIIDLPPEDATGTLMSATSPAIMTNKTFDANGTGNALSNVEPADFKAESGKLNEALVRDGVTGAVTSALITNANISGSAAIADGKLATISTAGKVSNSATTATSSNVNSAIVARDASGNFSAGTVTATFSGNLTGNVTGNVSGTALNVTGIVATANGGTGQNSTAVFPGSGTVAVLTDISASNLSGILATSKGGTGQNSTAVFPTSGTVAVLTDISASQLTGIVPGSKGGTGVNNAGTLTYGTNNITLTTSGVTSLTLPTSGTVATLADITTSQITGTLSPAKGGTGVSNNAAATLTRTGNFDLNITTTAASAVTMPTSGTLATLAGTEQLTNKDIAGGTASNTSRITLPSAAKSTLDGLTRKQATLVYGSDTNKVYADDGSTLKEIGSGSSGINYLSSQYGADSLGTVQTSVGNVLASSTRSNPSQWGNSAASALITQSTDSTLRGTTNYLVAYTANAQFVESPLFNIDGEDLGKPLLVQFDVSGVGTADDVQVYIARYNSSNVLQERILVAGTASATTPNSAQVPTGVSTFRGFFIPSSTATDKYAVRWLRNANNTSMRLDTFFVGPQSLAQGAVITKYQDWTPTGSWSSNTAYAGKWRRVGNMMEIDLAITLSGAPTASALTVNLPSGYTIDSNSIALSSGSLTTDRVWFGDVSIGNADGYFGKVGYNSSTSVRLLSTNASGTYLKDDTITNLVPKTLGSGDFITAHFSVPINEWSSGTTTLADRAVEEYAYNTDTTASSNTSSFANGPDGALMPNRSAGTGVTKRIRFQTPILPTDSIVVEYQQGSGTPWKGASQRYPLTVQGTLAYGIEAALVIGSSTDLDIQFGSGGAQGGGVYGGNGDPWSSYYSIGTKWRVRKVSSGAAVGFPVSARNVVGDTSGTTVPAGYVGEQLSQTWTGQTITTSTTTLATHSFVQTGVYLFIIETDCSKGSATRITSSFSGTATISVTRTASGGDYVTMLDATGACLYATYYARVTGAGSITFTSQATTANATSSRGSFSIVRIA